MPLLGKAAILLSFDVVEDAIPEHDDWHTHEHLPERLCIPGFVRGTRWVSLAGKPRYFVMYEVDQLATLQSEAYLERLNNPSPWTSKMMPNYRSMTRGFWELRFRHGSCRSIDTFQSSNRNGVFTAQVAASRHSSSSSFTARDRQRPSV